MTYRVRVWLVIGVLLAVFWTLVAVVVAGTFR